MPSELKIPLFDNPPWEERGGQLRWTGWMELVLCLPLEGVPVGGGWIVFWPLPLLSSLGGGVTIGDGGGLS